MRVLVALDGSAPAERAVDLTAGLAWPAGTTIRLVQAVDSGAALFGGPWPTLALLESAMIESDLRAAAERTLTAASARLERPEWTVDTAVVRGRAATAIVSEAKDMKAELIVIGSRGHGTIESMLLGSVSAEVIDHASMPVLVARGKEMNRVVLAWDGSSGALHAADLVRSWPIFGRASVRVVAVADVAFPWWTGFPESGSLEVTPLYIEAANASRRDCERLAREMTSQLRAAGLTAEADPREGDAAAGILGAATSSNADLIVLGTRGWTGLKRLVIGSVARNVLHHAPCSVFVVPDRSTNAAAAGSP